MYTILRRKIGGIVGALRRARQMSQTELAIRLGFSQARLSQIERGAASLTAEEFLQVLEIFNVSADRFVERDRAEPDAQLQNALVALGATHLHQREGVVPSDRLSKIDNVVREALVSREPRIITALGPVLVNNIDRIQPARIHERLSNEDSIPLVRRFLWLLENIVTALMDELAGPLPRTWARPYSRALLVLERYNAKSRGLPLHIIEWEDDILDVGIRSKKTLRDVESASSRISQRWRIVTDLQPSDFAAALRASRAVD